MKNIVHTIFIFILAASCTSNTIYEKPKNLISKSKMVDILVDIYLAEGAKSVENKDLERLVDYMPLVYEKHKIDSLQFAESNFYYTSKIDDYEDIFKKVNNRLKTMKTEYETMQKVEDSIKQGKLYKNKNLRNKPNLDNATVRKHEKEEDY
jgi:hypothetical protein